MTLTEFQHKLTSVQSVLRKMALNFTTDFQNIEDLCQETSLKALTNYDKYSEPGNFNSWLYTIMKNTYINNYKRASRSSSLDDEMGERKLLKRIEKPDAVTPYSDYAYGEVTKGIETLDSEIRIPLKQYLAGFKYKEIAEQLDIPIGTVKSKIFFARKKLAALIPDYAPDSYKTSATV